MSTPNPLPAALSRRALVRLGLAASLAPGLAFAQAYPARPIRIVVGFVPGGSTDFGARLIATGLADVMGVPVVVENKPGATGVIASEYVGKATPDGYTLLVGTATPIIVAPQAMARQGFNPLTDLVPINMVAESAMSFAVNPRLSVRRMKDLVALSRTRPVTIGISGLGGSLHLLVEALIQSTGGNFVVVPYKGSGPSVADTIAGHIDANDSDVGTFIPFHNDGKLAIVGVATEKRMELLPNVPTVQEDVPGLVMGSWLGVFAPARTPKPVVDKINAALMKVIARDEVRAQFVKSAYAVSAMPDPDAFAKYVASDYQRYGKVIKDRGILVKE